MWFLTRSASIEIDDVNQALRTKKILCSCTSSLFDRSFCSGWCKKDLQIQVMLIAQLLFIISTQNITNSWDFYAKTFMRRVSLRVCHLSEICKTNSLKWKLLFEETGFKIHPAYVHRLSRFARYLHGIFVCSRYTSFELPWNCSLESDAFFNKHYVQRIVFRGKGTRKLQPAASKYACRGACINETLRLILQTGNSFAIGYAKKRFIRRRFGSRVTLCRNREGVHPFCYLFRFTSLGFNLPLRI